MVPRVFLFVLASVVAIGCRGLNPEYDGPRSDTEGTSTPDDGGDTGGGPGGTGGDATGGGTTGGGVTGGDTGGTSDSDGGTTGGGTAGTGGTGTTGSTGGTTDSDTTSDGSTGSSTTGTTTTGSSTSAGGCGDAPNFPDPVGPHKEIVVGNASLGGSGQPWIVVAPGQQVQLRFDYDLASCGCPGCIAQGVVGFVGQGWSDCFYEGVPGCAGVERRANLTLTAPSAPGNYTLSFDRTWQYSCRLDLANLEPEQVFAGLCVQE